MERTRPAVIRNERSSAAGRARLPTWAARPDPTRAPAPTADLPSLRPRQPGSLAADRYAIFAEFFKNFYNTHVLLTKRVSEQAVQAGWNVGASASVTASHDVPKNDPRPPLRSVHA